jgi:hypothetical protein
VDFLFGTANVDVEVLILLAAVRWAWTAWLRHLAGSLPRVADIAIFRDAPLFANPNYASVPGGRLRDMPQIDLVGFLQRYAHLDEFVCATPTAVQANTPCFASARLSLDAQAFEHGIHGWA